MSDNDDSDSSLSLHSIDVSKQNNPTINYKNMLHQQPMIPFQYIDPALLSPLMRASYQNDVKYVMEAIAQGKELNCNDNRGYTALHYAAEARSVDVLKLLVKQPLIRLDVENHDSETPLHRAIEKCNDPEVVEILVKAGASIKVVSCYGHSPLLVLVYKENTNLQVMLEMGKILLENGDDNYIKDEANVLVEAVRLHERLAIGQYDDWLNFVCMFLYYGADVNLRCDFGDSAISLAIQLECNELCSLMLPYLTDFNIIFETPTQLNTLFLLAVKHKSPDVFYMIERGADINFSNGLESCLELSITHSMGLFEYIFTHCDDDTILNEMCFIDKFFLKNRFDRDEFIRCIYLIFKHSLVAELFALSGIRQIHMHFVAMFLRLDVSIEEQIKILYSLLMYSNQLTASDLCDIFSVWGYDERFEAYLRVTIVIEDLETFFLQQDTLITCLCFPDAFQPKTKQFPTLQALSRNCVRRHIRKDLIYGANNVSFKYYNYLLRLNVPLIIQDILTLKRLV